MSRGDCGICGLPNVGKSTVFTALTSLEVAIENYPFCTIEPNRGVVPVPDRRIDTIGDILGIEKRIPPVVEFVDIAGLVEGAASGEGLGNKFLSHIREVDMLVHVVRCFADDDVVHVAGAIDPLRDIDTIRVELCLADIDTVERRIEKNERLTRSSDRGEAKHARDCVPLYEKTRTSLEKGIPVVEMELDEIEREELASLHLLTAKDVLYLCNTGEDDDPFETGLVGRVVERFGPEHVLSFCGKLEAEIAAIPDPGDRRDFLRDAGLETPGYERLIHAVYRGLGLRTFFTENGDEVRGWTFDLGATAPVAAGTIHTDFRDGFIRAEVYSWKDLEEAGSLQALRRSGMIRTEGRTYEVCDGDVMKIKFQPPVA